jgi:cellulose biosynthesis protein BcsQ
VLLVDADPQGDSSRFLLGYERRARGLQGKRAWTHLIPKAASKQLSKNDVESCLIESPALGRTRGTHLERVDVLACDDPDWENLDMALRREKNKKLLALGLKGLRHSISLLADDYDICIIDFPGTNLGPMAKMALHATDRWLFPCIPNAAGLGRLDRAIRLVGQVNLKEGGQVQPLVTVPARCPNRSRGEYKNGRAFLDEQAKANMIPPVVSREAELSERVEAENAIGTGMATGSSTINQRYGKPGKGLIDEMVPLCEEILHGLEMSFEKIDTLENHTELQEAFAGFSGGAKVNRRRRQK